MPERFFLNVALLRVLYAHALSAAPRLALGRFAPLGRVLGDPRLGMAGAFLSLGRVLPDGYPLRHDLDVYLVNEHGLGRTLDYGVIGPRIQTLYDWSAGELHLPGLHGLVRDAARSMRGPMQTGGSGSKCRSRLPSACSGSRPRPGAVTLSTSALLREGPRHELRRCEHVDEVPVSGAAQRDDRRCAERDRRSCAVNGDSDPFLISRISPGPDPRRRRSRANGRRYAGRRVRLSLRALSSRSPQHGCHRRSAR